MKKLITMLSMVILSGCGAAETMSENCGGDLQLFCEAVFGTNANRISSLETDVSRLKKQVSDMELTLSTNLVTINSVQTALAALQGRTSVNETMIANLQTNVNSSNALITGLQLQVASAVSQIQALQTNASHNASAITALQASVTSNTTLITVLQTNVSSLQSSLNALTTTTNSNASQISSLQANLATLQATVNSNVQQLAVLNGYSHILGFVDPCGDAPNRYDEVFLKIYQPSTGKTQLIASFSDNSSGLNTRFSVLPPGGPYVTTDGDNCQFKVANDGFTITNENHHY